MLISQASLTIRPLTAAAFATFEENYGTGVVPVLTRFGYRLLGAFQRHGAESIGNLLNIYAFDSFTDMDERRNEFGRHPEEQRATFNLLRDVQITEVSKLATPVSWWDETTCVRLARDGIGGRHLLQVVMQAGARAGHPKLADLRRRLVDLRAQGGSELVLAYEDTIGLRGEITEIWTAPGPLGFADDGPGTEVAAIIEACRQYAPEERHYFLTPLAYSPLR